MRLLAISRRPAGVTLEDLAPHQLREAAQAWHLHRQGVFAELYFRKDPPGAVVLLDCPDLPAGRRTLDSLPMVAAGVLEFDLYEIGAFTPFANLFSDAARTVLSALEKDPAREPVIVRGRHAEPHPFHGSGTIARLLYPSTVGSDRLFVGVTEVGPGQAPHVFHRHGTEVVGANTLSYAADFEEFYFVVRGSGTMQWKRLSGELIEHPVAAGDAIYMPPGVVEHRILNTSTESLRVLYGGTPPALVTATEAEAEA